jgi:hypothetical protein
LAGYQRYNLADLKVLTADRVGNVNFWYPADEMQWAINEAISVWQAVTGFWTISFPMSLVLGQSFYELPKQLTSVKRVTYLGAPLSQTSTPELDLGFGGWEGTTGTPEFWAPEGINLIAIHPTAAGVVVLEGTSDAPWLNADADFIDISDDDLNAILEYAHHYLTFKEGGQEFKSSLSGLQSFLEQAAMRNSRLRASNFFKKYQGLDHEAEQRRVETPTPPGVRV